MLLLLPFLLVLVFGLPLVPVLELTLCGIAAGLILALFLAPEQHDRL